MARALLSASDGAEELKRCSQRDPPRLGRLALAPAGRGQAVIVQVLHKLQHQGVMRFSPGALVQEHPDLENEVLVASANKSANS